VLTALLSPRLAVFTRTYPDIELDITSADDTRGDLVRVFEYWCPPFDGYFLYYPSRRHLSPALQMLVDMLRV